MLPEGFVQLFRFYQSGVNGPSPPLFFLLPKYEVRFSNFLPRKIFACINFCANLRRETKMRKTITENYVQLKLCENSQRENLKVTIALLLVSTSEILRR